MSYKRIMLLSTNNSEFESHSKNTEMNKLGRVRHYCKNVRALEERAITSSVLTTESSRLLCGSKGEQSHTMHHDLTLILYETKSQLVSPVNTKWFSDRWPGWTSDRFTEMEEGSFTRFQTSLWRSLQCIISPRDGGGVAALSLNMVSILPFGTEASSASQCFSAHTDRL